MLKFLKSFFGGGPAVNFRELVAEGAMIVDVRTPAEYSEGHLEKSVNIPLQVLQQKIPDLKKKHKKIITVCRSGNRSGMARNMLIKQGIEAYNGGPWNSLQRKLS
jgi:rhodanese-related sulfurtransferase